MESDGAMRILVVEDDDDVRTSLADLLALHGFEVREAASGAEARAALYAGEAPQAIVLDLHGTDGRTLVEELRRTPALAAVAIVVVSGFQVPDDDPLRQAATVFMKPLEVSDLVRVLSRVTTPCPRGLPPGRCGGGAVPRMS